MLDFVAPSRPKFLEPETFVLPILGVKLVVAWINVSSAILVASLAKIVSQGLRHFRFSVWDPFLIVSQIFTLQGLFYASLGVFIYISDLATDVNKSLDHFFLYEALHVKDAHGRFIIISYLLNSLIGAFGLWFFVQRTRLCLDFSSTCHILHLIICWCYNDEFPNTLSWWLLNVACVAITCVCGEFLCMRTELKAIPLSLGPKSDL